MYKYSLYIYIYIYIPRPGRKQARNHVKERPRFQQHRDASCHQVFFFLQSKVPKEFHVILTETLARFLRCIYTRIIDHVYAEL